MNQGTGRSLNSWRQGCQVDPEYALDNGLIEASDAKSVLLVATHDCDLQSTAESEVEIFLATIVDTARPECTQGKSPRTLHLPGAFGVDGALAIVQGRTFRVAKELLLASDPIQSLDDSDRSLLATWLASRYKRAAFPDSLDQRMRRAKTIDRTKLADKNIANIKKDRSLAKQLLGVFTTDCGPVEGIYLGLSGKESVELAPSDTYSLTIVVVAKSRHPNEEEAALKTASIVAATIQGLFENATWDKSAGEIILKASVPTTERSFSLYEFRRMLRWHLDWLSADDLEA